MSQELNELEQALLAMTPAASRLDRDALMYAAGRRSSRRWIWPAAACGFALLSAGLSLFLAFRKPQVIERTIVVHDTPASTPQQRSTIASESQNDGDTARNELNDPLLSPYLKMEHEILRRGDVPLPTPEGTAQGAATLPWSFQELDLPPERLRALHLSPSS
jgi:hypothetical protein